MEPVLSATGHWPAPAKLNLFLHITGRRADGYHLLQTVFQFLDYGDELDIRPRTDGQIRRLSQLEGVAEHDDLVVRAARLLQEVSATRQGADIEVIKTRGSDPTPIWIICSTVRWKLPNIFGSLLQIIPKKIRTSPTVCSGLNSREINPEAIPASLFPPTPNPSSRFSTEGSEESTIRKAPPTEGFQTSHNDRPM